MANYQTIASFTQNTSTWQRSICRWGFNEAADLLFSTAFMAYSTWNTRPSGEKVEADRSYCRRHTHTQKGNLILAGSQIKQTPYTPFVRSSALNTWKNSSAHTFIISNWPYWISLHLFCTCSLLLSLYSFINSCVTVTECVSHSHRAFQMSGSICL